MRNVLRRLTFAAAIAAGVVVADEARANGRFPESNKVVVTPGDPDTLYLRVTFGLVVSRDRGHSWDWVCERSIGFTGTEDPMYAATPGGSLIATTLIGLSVSNDRACSFAFAGGDLAGRLFVDLSQRPDDPRSVVVFASAYQGMNDAGSYSFDSQLWETKDEGRTFAPLGPKLDPSLYGLTLDVTGTDPDRLYMSGVRDPSGTPAGLLLTSRDRGTTFETAVVPFEGREDALYIAAVDPANADRIYARTSGKEDAPSRLLVSDDAGKTFRTVHRANGPLRGFALSPDGARVYIGGPLDGLLAANATDLAFSPRSALRVQCLTATADGLWACSDEASGFIAGLSVDEGATFEPRLRFCDIRGPLACPVGSSTHTQCTLGGPAEPRTPPWFEQKRFLGCGGLPDAGATPPEAPPQEEDGCACRASKVDGWRTPAMAALAASVALAILRRRRRR